MKFDILSRRVAAAAGVSALAAGALVATTSTADATPVLGQVYECAAGPSTFPLFMDSDVTGIDSYDSIAAGTPVPAALPVTNVFTVPDEVFAQLTGVFMVNHMEFPGFAGSFGGQAVGINLGGVDTSEFVDNGNGTHSVTATGFNQAFTVPKAGSYDVLSPQGFDITATNPGGDIPVTCEFAGEGSPGSYRHIDVFKNDSATAAKAAKSKLKKGKKGVVKATVTADNVIPTGKVLLKNKKGKTVDSANLKGGKASLTTSKLVKGKNVYSVVYKGDGFAKGSKSKSVTITGTK